jgi:hypothetical protein
MLPQAFQQLGQGLVRSLREYDVYDDGSDPTKTWTWLISTSPRRAAGQRRWDVSWSSRNLPSTPRVTDCVSPNDLSAEEHFAHYGATHAVS